ncbi:MAG TPA: hypothetical protein VD906_16220 [Caulobacteraceae bacterium]|nr:hypothetical protein [Caulobacteraceae bacterium]
MSIHKLQRDVAVCAALIFVLSAGPSHAYLDPGTGSVVLTGILGIFAAIAYSVRRFFYRIARVFRPGAAQEADED